MENQTLNHKRLCEIGGKWLKKECKERCPVVAIELKSYASEIPDVFGVNGSNSVIIECKMSRSDFRKDADKFWRREPQFGVGDFRYYLCPEGLIKPDEVPENWGLLYANAEGKVIAAKEIMVGNCNGLNPNKIEKNIRSERCILYSILRRVFQSRAIKEFDNFM